MLLKNRPCYRKHSTLFMWRLGVEHASSLVAMLTNPYGTPLIVIDAHHCEHYSPCRAWGNQAMQCFTKILPVIRSSLWKESWLRMFSALQCRGLFLQTQSDTTHLPSKGFPLNLLSNWSLGCLFWWNSSPHALLWGLRGNEIPYLSVCACSQTCPRTPAHRWGLH